ncbi:hypothetical protein [Stenotrophomonas maltophilia]|uniref:hypothetical protein n=1 Tax=Stenotrophomonas maltophilia TaxID=40324 RepID=UPI0021C5E31D|nr:hypothetical protein [Stenotrophomonas maltophilia]
MGGTDLLGSRPRWRGAREVIDWTMTGKRIFTRTKPLRPNTLRRILAGAVKYYWPRPYTEAVQPLLDDQAPRLVFSRAKAVALGLVSADALMVHLRGTSEQHLQATAKSADEPLPTLTAGGSHVGLVLATSSGGAARDLDQSLPTMTTGGAGAERFGFARPQLGEPIIVPTPNTSSAGVPRSAAEPIRTVTTAQGGDQALAVPLVAQYYGATHQGGERVRGLDERLPTITGANLGELGLAAAAADGADEIRIDINYRMLHWREVARATSFDDEGEIYDFAANATEITKQIGNVPNRTVKVLAIGPMRDAA